MAGGAVITWPVLAAVVGLGSAVVGGVWTTRDYVDERVDAAAARAPTREEMMHVSEMAEAAAIQGRANYEKLTEMSADMRVLRQVAERLERRVDWRGGGR